MEAQPPKDSCQDLQRGASLGHSIAPAQGVQRVEPVHTASAPRAVQVSTVTSAMAYMSVGFDNSWDHDAWAESFDIVVTRREKDLLEFELINVDPAIVNALRRALISEVPTVAIEHVFVIDNNSEMAEEVLAHRLGLVPLTIDAEELADKDGAATEANTVVFKLHVQCRKARSHAVHALRTQLRVSRARSGLMHMHARVTLWLRRKLAFAAGLDVWSLPTPLCMHAECDRCGDQRQGARERPAVAARGQRVRGGDEHAVCELAGWRVCAAAGRGASGHTAVQACARAGHRARGARYTRPGLGPREVVAGGDRLAPDVPRAAYKTGAMTIRQLSGFVGCSNACAANVYYQSRCSSMASVARSL